MWTYPEPLCDILAQIGALKNGRKQAVYVCGPLDSSLVPKDFIAVKRKEGTLITASQKLADLYRSKPELTEGDMALILGYPESKTEISGHKIVIQALNKDGAVIVEAATSINRLYDTADFISSHVPDDGRLNVTDAISAIARRAEKLGEENARIS